MPSSWLLLAAPSTLWIGSFGLSCLSQSFQAWLWRVAVLRLFVHSDEGPSGAIPSGRGQVSPVLLHMLCHTSIPQLTSELVRWFIVTLPAVAQGPELPWSELLWCLMGGGVMSGAAAAALVREWYQRSAERRRDTLYTWGVNVLSQCGAWVLRAVPDVVSPVLKPLFGAAVRDHANHAAAVSGGAALSMGLSGFRWVVYGESTGWLLLAPVLLRRVMFRLGSSWVAPSSVESSSSDALLRDSVQDAADDTIILVSYGTGVCVGLLCKTVSYVRLGRAVVRALHAQAIRNPDGVAQMLRELPGEVLGMAERVVEAYGWATPNVPPVQASPALIAAYEQQCAPVEFLCPLTLQLFQHPVVAADGHTYEASAIRQWLRTSRRSPTCGSDLQSGQLVANYALRSLMESWRPTAVTVENARRGELVGDGDESHVGAEAAPVVA